jgi:hypothetical protein
MHNVFLSVKGVLTTDTSFFTSDSALYRVGRWLL